MAMAESTWVLVVLGVLLIVGRLRGRDVQPRQTPPEYVPQTGAQPIPPTGSR